MTCWEHMKFKDTHKLKLVTIPILITTNLKLITEEKGDPMKTKEKGEILRTGLSFKMADKS